METLSRRLKAVLIGIPRLVERNTLAKVLSKDGWSTFLSEDTMQVVELRTQPSSRRTVVHRARCQL